MPGYHVQNVVRWPWRVNAFRFPWFFYGFSLWNKAGSGNSVTRRHTLSKRWKVRNIWRTVPIKILGKPYPFWGMGEMYNFRIILHPNIWHQFFNFSPLPAFTMPRPLWRTSSDFCSYCSVVSLGWLIKISVIPEWQQSPGCKKNLPIKLMIIFWRYEEVVRIDHFPVNIPVLVFIYKALKPTHLVPKKMAAAAFWPLISSMIFSWHPSHPPFDNSYRSAWRGHSIQYTNICQWLMFAPGGWTPIISVEILTPWADSRWLEKSSCTDNVMMSKKKTIVVIINHTTRKFKIDTINAGLKNVYFLGKIAFFWHLS